MIEALHLQKEFIVSPLISKWILHTDEENLLDGVIK